MANQSIKKRLDDLKRAVDPQEDGVRIVVDWGGDVLRVDGVEITRRDYESKYSDRVVVSVPVGIDLGLV